MKRFLSKSITMLLAVVMVLGLCSTGLGELVQVSAAWVDSEGYTVITTASELDTMVRNNMGGKFRLGADINLSQYSYNSKTWTSGGGWDAMGKSSGKAFTGSFDGNGYAIKGLWSYYRGENQGLFSRISGGTVKNLTIELAANNGIAGSGSDQGALAGQAISGATIENVRIVGAGSGSAVYGGPGNIGGLVGYVNGSHVVSCSVTNIGVSSHFKAGGIAGYVGGYSDITNCSVNNVEVECKTYSGEAGGAGGGLVGHLCNGAIIKGSNVTYAKISVTGDLAGGVVGRVCSSNCMITDSYAQQVTVITGGKYAGGFAGDIFAKATIKNCYVLTATVEAKQGFGGGFVGFFENSYASRCYAVWVNVKGSYMAGGWAGEINTGSRVEISCAYGSAEATKTYGVGGFVGFVNGSVAISNCYAQVDVTVNQKQYGGGFVGSTIDNTSLSINNSYCVSNINVNGVVSSSYVGAFSGKTFIKFTGTNYYDYQVIGPTNWGAVGIKSGLASAYPQGNNTATMKTKSTFVGWDFNNIWRIDEGTTYPYFWYMGSIQTEDPTINTITEGDRTVTGNGIAGAVITVTYPNGSTSYAVVGSTGTWTTVVPSSVNLVRGNVVSAVQQQGIKLASNRVYTTVIGVSKSAPPVINRVMEGEDVITGTGIAGSGITVTLPNGTTVSATVGSGGTWMANVPSGVVLKVGEVISAVQLETGKTVSDPATTTVVGNTDVDPGIDVFVENLTSGKDYATAGDTLLYDVVISNNGTASSTWESAYVTFILDRAAALQVSSIRINNRIATSSQYEYDSAANTLTLYLGDIVGGNSVSISFRTTISDNVANINQLVLESILGSLRTRSIIYKW